MDIATITDIQALKALAYDQLMLQMRTESNLKLITQRIEQLTAEQAAPAPAPRAAQPSKPAKKS